MDETAQWVLQNSWSGLIAGAAIGFAIAALITTAYFYGRGAGNPDNNPIRELAQNRHWLQLQLQYGDAKALADLAIQRHMGDSAFLQRLRAQPCYTELWLHFSENFQQKVLTVDHKFVDLEARPTLAAACREEIERLERERSAPLAPHSGLDTASAEIDAEDRHLGLGHSP